MITTSPVPWRFRLGGSGTKDLLRFALRRERFTLPWWLLGTAALLVLQSSSSQQLYDTPEKLAALRETIGANAATTAMSGPTELLATIGGEILWEVFGYMAIVVALMNMFLIGRHTRSDEEAGRAELIRSARVGRRAPAFAALALAGLADCAVILVVFGAALATGLPAGGSFLAAVALAAVGAAFAAVTSVAAQVFENPRSVYGSVVLLLTEAYLLRAMGDVGNPAMSWLSPIGWAQRTYPYVSDRWWPVLLLLAVTAVLTGVAFVLLDRRDFGAGLLPYRAGPPNASALLSSALGLAWRLQRGALAAWCVGVFVLGLAYGSLADSIEDFLADNPGFAAYLPGGTADAVDSFLALTLSLAALLAAAYGINGALRARSEETGGRAEPLLAAPVGRGRWLMSHAAIAYTGSAAVLLAGGLGEGLAHGLTVGDAGEGLRAAGAALTYLPAVWLIVAVAVLGFGWAPRAAAVLSWTALGYCAVALLFAESFDLPAWFGNASPFEHTPQAPLESPAAAPLLVILGLAVLMSATGVLGFRRRDTGY